MKKIIIIIIAITGLYSCKRKWTEKDKSGFLSGCLSSITKEMDEIKARRYCGCLLSKIAARYPNANDAKYVKYDTAVVRLSKDCLPPP